MAILRLSKAMEGHVIAKAFEMRGFEKVRPRNPVNVSRIDYYGDILMCAYQCKLFPCAILAEWGSWMMQARMVTMMVMMMVMAMVMVWR